MKTGKPINLISFLLLSLFLLGSISSSGQPVVQTIVKGFVTDASTNKPLAFVSVYFDGGKGVMTGEDGSYSIETQKTNLNTLVFTYTGYKKASYKIKVGNEQTLNVELQLAKQLSEVIIKTKRGKYRNKNNPAVELIDLVIQNKEKNRITAYNYVQYQQYEKLALSLANKPEKLMKNKLFKNYKFVLENVDTTTIEGKSILPIYIAEKLTNKYFKKDPSKEKTRLLGDKTVNYGDFLDNNGINQYLNMLYADINIYDNNITILASQFLSPIADGGPTFYRYYIRDTVVEDGVKLVKLYFTPRNPNDLLFRGTMYITLDGNYGVQKINMTISKNANLNWTRELRISQDFEKSQEDKRFHVIKSSMLAEFALTNGASGGIIGERTVSFKDFVFNQPAPDSIYNSKDLVDLTTAQSVTDTFWLSHRHNPLSSVEAKAYYNIDSLKNMKSFKRIGDIFNFLFNGYIGRGKWELGNTNTFYSFNDVEGFKLRIGGRTTPKFSNNLYFDHYAAYGFRDKKFKYLVGASYSFNHKATFAFPLNYVRISYQHDTNIPGQDFLFANEDNFFLSFKRGNNNKWLYNDYWKAEYVHEFGKNLSYTLTFKNWKQSPAGDIYFQKVADNSFVKDLTTTEASVLFRWAPNEQFYQGRGYRIPIVNKYPILTFRYVGGIKGLLGGEYNYHKFTLRGEKRFYMSQLGYADFSLEGGYNIGKMPFPLLSIPHANQTYGFQLESYNLMNFMEFVTDHYVASNVDLYFNGFFLNKLPLIKKLKLREVASFKFLAGGLRAENDPYRSNDVLKFPTDSTGQPTTFAFGNTPYMEVSVGIANIFKLVRLDVVKRLSYLENPNISKIGLRVRIRFDF